MSNQLFEQAGIPEHLWEHCVIKDGIIFTPITDEQGDIIKTANEVYENWQEQKDEQIEYQPSEVDKLAMEMTMLISSVNSSHIDTQGEMKRTYDKTILEVTEMAKNIKVYDFKEDDQIVRSWVRMIMNGHAKYEDVPDLGNLREVIKRVLEKEGWKPTE